MKPSLPILLSINGGYVDTAGFLALQGLFTAHVTGNFVTAGAALVFGTSGVVGKLLALPVFCIVVAFVHLAGRVLAARGTPPLRALLLVKLVLLVAGAVMAVRLGPFPNGDTWPALLTGMTLVSAMAVQNGAQRAHLSSAAPTTLMTGNTTQVVIDLVDLLHGLPGPQSAAARARLTGMLGNIVAFAAGCAAAAFFFAFTRMWCFAVPPLVALAQVGLYANLPAAVVPR